jgi:hypothetical protein
MGRVLLQKPTVANPVKKEAVPINPIKVFLVFVPILIRRIPTYIATHFNIKPSSEVCKVVPGFSANTFVCM